MTKAFDCAIRLLARRNHSAFELLEKLQRKGYGATEAQEALQSCQALHVQSDADYAESYCRWRIEQGYGPLKIRQELLGKRVDKEIIARVLDQEKDHWVAHAYKVWQKKGKTQGFQDVQKQQRFLLYRGFQGDTLAQVLKDLDDA